MKKERGPGGEGGGEEERGVGSRGGWDCLFVDLCGGGGDGDHYVGGRDASHPHGAQIRQLGLEGKQRNPPPLHHCTTAPTGRVRGEALAAEAPAMLRRGGDGPPCGGETVGSSGGTIATRDRLLFQSQRHCVLPCADHCCIRLSKAATGFLCGSYCFKVVVGSDVFP